MTLTTVGQASIAVYACDVPLLKHESDHLLIYGTAQSRGIWVKLGDEQNRELWSLLLDIVRESLLRILLLLDTPIQA